MNIGDKYSGFILKKVEEIKEFDLTFYEFFHEKSGATAVYLENDDTNRCFAAAFRTLPEDSTGVCHIIEHSVLGGSKKYPLKEPFVNLLKGSMATFLNAFTASDWTCYPVASQNEKDFKNLMDCYLDSVFNPVSMIDDKIFRQEGWHYELKDKDSMPFINGVVYNEMKGAMSSVMEILQQESTNALYKGSGYGVNSGGDPDVIPTLTYDYYKQFYKKHYHPENAILYLYGKMDIKERLEYIDREYLGNYERCGMKTRIDMPEPLVDTTVTKQYPIGEDEEIENNSYYSISFATCPYENELELAGMQILETALFDSNDSPLKKLLLEKKLGDDIQTSIDDDCIKPYLSIMLQKAKPGMKKLFFDALIESCKKVLQDGIDKDILLSIINNVEFKAKEMDTGSFPKGLAFMMSILNTFVYDLPLERPLYALNIYKELKKEIDNGFFEGLIEKYIINSDHYVIVELNPSKELSKEREEDMKDKMMSLKQSMTDEEIDEMVRRSEELLAFQSHKDTKEELSLLPTLELSDIDTSIRTINTAFDDNFIIHEVPTNGIAYLRLLFDCKNFTNEELAYSKILFNIIGEFDTENFTALELKNFTSMYLGSFSMGQTISKSRIDDPYIKVVASASALKENIKYMSIVFNEVFHKVIFDMDKMMVLLNQLKLGARNQIMGGGMTLGQNMAASVFDETANMISSLEGMNIYEKIQAMIASPDETLSKFKEIYKKAFNSARLTVSVSGSKEIIDSLREEVGRIEMISFEDIERIEMTKRENKAEAVVIPSEVNYDCLAIGYDEMGLKVSGTLPLLAHILRYDYFWNEVRVKGGAYGSSISFRNFSRVMTLGSYRDPNCANTYKVYGEIADYLKSFNPDELEFKTYIIGCLGDFDKPQSIYNDICDADLNIFTGNTDEYREGIKKEILSTTIEDIRSLSDKFRNLYDKAALYAFGNESKVKDSGRFDNLITLK